MAPQHRVAQRRLQARAGRNPPRSFGTVRHLEKASTQPQASQLSQPPAPVVPSLPEAAPHVSSYPAFQSEYLPAFLGQPVISPPASDVGAPVVPQLDAGSTLAASP